MSGKDWKKIALQLAATLESQNRDVDRITIEGDGNGTVLSSITEEEAQEEQDAEAKGFTAFRRKVAKIIGG
jgi:hypothetical protein